MVKVHTFAAVAFGATFVMFGAGCGGGGEKPAADASSNQPAAATPAGNAPAAAGGDAVQMKKCSGDTAPAADGLIDDLEDNDGAGAQQGGRQGYWYVSKDDKGSTIDPSELKNMSDGGANGSKKALHVSGKTLTVDGAWGAGFGIGFGQPKQSYDASKYAGISFFIKAGPKGTKNIRVKVSDVNTHPDGGVCKDGCWNHFGKDLVVTDQWQEVKVLFADMKQQDGWGDPHPASITPNKVFDINFGIDKGQDFDFWVDDLKFLDCK